MVSHTNEDLTTYLLFVKVNKKFLYRHSSIKKLLYTPSGLREVVLGFTVVSMTTVTRRNRSSEVRERLTIVSGIPYLKTTSLTFRFTSFIFIYFFCRGRHY